MNHSHNTYHNIILILDSVSLWECRYGNRRWIVMLSIVSWCSLFFIFPSVGSNCFCCILCLMCFLLTVSNSELLCLVLRVNLLLHLHLENLLVHFRLPKLIIGIAYSYCHDLVRILSLEYLGNFRSPWWNDGLLIEANQLHWIFYWGFMSFWKSSWGKFRYLHWTYPYNNW